VIFDKAHVPELDGSFVEKAQDLKEVHRDDDGGWLTGSIKKHKLTSARNRRAERRILRC
jgi:hypothetical protein